MLYIDKDKIGKILYLDENFVCYSTTDAPTRESLIQDVAGVLSFTRELMPLKVQVCALAISMLVRGFPIKRLDYY